MFSDGILKYHAVKWKACIKMRKKRGNSVEKFNTLTKKMKNRKFCEKSATNTGHWFKISVFSKLQKGKQEEMF